MPTARPALWWRAVCLPKRGNAADEYEDAFAANAGAGRFAVADGASESSFAGLWARLLTEGFASAKRPWDDFDWLAPLRRRWAEDVDARPLPWFAETKREEGAFATLLGAAFLPPREGLSGRWRALAVGDCCLFRVGRGRVVQSFPLHQSSDFGNRPSLLGSRAPRRGEPEPRLAHGRWRAGDHFLLATDALAQWFLRRTEEGGRPWEEVEPLLADNAPEGALASWAEERRAGGDLHNDDVTLLAVRLEPEPPPPER